MFKYLENVLTNWFLFLPNIIFGTFSQTVFHSVRLDDNFPKTGSKYENICNTINNLIINLLTYFINIEFI